jgi:hypothetical protein
VTLNLAVDRAQVASPADRLQCGPRHSRPHRPLTLGQQRAVASLQSVNGGLFVEEREANEATPRALCQHGKTDRMGKFLEQVARQQLLRHRPPPGDPLDCVGRLKNVHRKQQAAATLRWQQAPRAIEKRLNRRQLERRVADHRRGLKRQFGRAEVAHDYLPP